MRITERRLRASGLPTCWAAAYQALRPAPKLDDAVHHTVESLDRMPAGYRYATAAMLRVFPAAFYAVTRRRIRDASPGEVRTGLTRLRRLPGCADVLRATTALALYGALDSSPARRVRAKEAVK